MKWRLDDGQIEVVDDAVAEVLRRKTPGERIAMVGAAWRFARTWIESAVRSQHPDWNAGQVQREVAKKMSGPLDDLPRHILYPIEHQTT